MTSQSYRKLNLFVFVNPKIPDMVGSIGVLMPRKKGWSNAEFVVDGSSVIMVNPDSEEDVRPLSWKDRVVL